MSSLEGKVAIVTGGAGGIGAATVAALAEAGARVVVADVAEDAVGEVVDTLTAQGHKVAGRVVDVSSEDSVRSLVRFTVDTFGGVDVVDNNAALVSAIKKDRDVVAMPVELWDEVMAVNLRGPMLLAKHTVPVLIERGGGSIINIASGQGLSGDRTMVAYGSSKGGLIALTRFIAAAYGEHGIRCNTLAPGLVKTPALDADMPPFVQDKIKEHNLIPRLGTPADVAAFVVFLASDAAGFVTGQTISVDGGFLSHLPTLAKLAPPGADAGNVADRT
ncbi:SDR family NAD(P)-dependent oxidoreductase [Actinokineospora bangkokensis]|uniref:Short-chain dehydrogenase n=1 Tax=Actinokineospora bangkokensis TaxID=1193682 RepID=A0A1Q9LMJ2_9PSEU|nr:SDR family NAD(P)-dependent oxidoreductase [Actinokineospora bangkokensis]OLR93223.1 short-chain dehydrogenase [Actinokineospora bangkokensis]